MVGAVLFVALQAEFFAGILADLVVSVVASGAVESALAADLVRAGNRRRFLKITMALEADGRRDCTQVVRGAGQADVVSRFLEAGQLDRNATLIHSHLSRLGRRGRSGRDVVVGIVACQTGEIRMGVLGGPPFGTGAHAFCSWHFKQTSDAWAGCIVLKFRIKPGCFPRAFTCSLAGPWQASHDCPSWPIPRCTLC